ncbi:hypothetical protein GW17_00052252 [Ensete ventricosum]|nr:hypothetical protein GW17_00052252 [Ensete ventricosum]
MVGAVGVTKEVEEGVAIVKVAIVEVRLQRLKEKERTERSLLASFEVLVLEAIPYLVAIGVAMSDDVIVLGNLSGEIVYPCILDPDGEDEGGQASSSLAISTRWISAVKLLPSDLTTLAQREGGE